MVCGKLFHLKPYHNNKYKTHTCSKECAAEAKRIRMLGINNHQYGLKGTLNSSWKTNEKITHYGYKKIRVLDHPFRDCDDFVFEHRLIAEQFLLTEENSIEIGGNRYLKQEYAVHHKDENKLNNSPDNLEVMLKGEHAAFHCRKNKQPKDITTGRFISN